MNTKSQLDVIVVGAGPAGAAAAQILATRGAVVELWEAASQPRSKIGENLSPAAAPLLRRLNVRTQLGNDGHLPSYGNVSAWGSTTCYAADFIYHPLGHAWQLDRAVFERRLLQAAGNAGAGISLGAKFTGITIGRRGWVVSGSKGGSRFERTARWVIDATGRQSTVARRLGARRQCCDRLVALCSIQTCRTSSEPRDEDSRSFIESAADGWWYSALLPGHRRVFAWMTDSDLLSGQGTNSDARFYRQLQRTVHLRELAHKHGYTPKESACCRPATSARITPVCGDRWVALGDAACAFDPLSAQGIVFGLNTGVAAADAVWAALQNDWSLLERYQADVDAAWVTFQLNRRAYYRQEQRWSMHPFWSRRH